MSIPAHLEQPTQASGHRGARRQNLHLKADGTIAQEAATDVIIHDLSTSGLLLESSAPLSSGEKIQVTLPHAGVRSAKVVWAQGSYFGCEFDRPVPRASVSAAQLLSGPQQAEEAVDEEASRAPHEAAEASLGSRLRRARIDRGLSIADVVAELGVSRPTVWAWEKGRTTPKAERLKALSALYGISERELMFGAPDVQQSEPRQVESESAPSGQLPEVIARSKSEIAAAAGTSLEKVRIIVEL
jgi:transcriptional regulator with XRE-family HTH domain